jgi:antitoxin CptB
VSTAEDSGETHTQAQEREVLRLRWQCRRGMLELDLLLNRFLDTGFADLGPVERIAFNRLLGYQDQILYDWLMGHAVPADAELRGLLGNIRACMRR